MIETALYFALGFLTAGLLALMVMPAIWRRAVRLTRRRLEASTPLSRSEIQAEKDRLAASFAMTTRRLELAAADLRRKTAEHMAEAGRQRDATFRAEDERDAARARVAELEDRERELSAAIEAHETALAKGAEAAQASAEELVARDLALAEREARIGVLLGQIEDRNLEISTQTTRIDSLTVQVGDLRKDLATTREKLIRAESELVQRDTSLALERDKVARLEGQVARLETELADAQDNLERNIRNLSRATEAIAEADGRIKSLDRQVAYAPRRPGHNEAPAIEALERQRQELEARLAATAAERDRLSVALEDARRWREEPAGASAQADNTVLREKLGDLAAEVVRLTRAVQGEGSEVARLVAEAPAEPRSGRKSLIDRIRALDAPAGRPATPGVRPPRAEERV